jgi:hypothetical protein
MPATYVNIASTTLGSSQATVTFSSISTSYTDLAIRWSARTDRSGWPYDNITFRFNSVASNNNYGTIRIIGSNGSVASQIDSNLSYITLVGANAVTASANTFASGELYLPSYLSSRTKQIGMFSAVESNSTFDYISLTSNTFVPTSAINRIDISTLFGTNFVSGSTFYLYGIKNS